MAVVPRVRTRVTLPRELSTGWASIHCAATSAGNEIRLMAHDEGAGCDADVTPRAVVDFGGFLALRGVNVDDHFDILDTERRRYGHVQVSPPRCPQYGPRSPKVHSCWPPPRPTGGLSSDSTRTTRGGRKL
jgi:hypothetical protein